MSNKNILEKNTFLLSNFITPIASMTGYQNILLALKYFSIRANKKIILELAAALNLKNQMMQKVSSFSELEQKKLLIIISLLKNPKILLIDDLFKNLDKMEILTICNQLSTHYKTDKNILILTGTNIEDFVGICNKYIFMYVGNIIGTVKIDDIKNGLYRYFHITLDYIEENYFERFRFIRNYQKISDHTWAIQLQMSDINLLLQSIIKDNILIYQLVDKSVHITGELLLDST